MHPEFSNTECVVFFSLMFALTFGQDISYVRQDELEMDLARDIMDRDMEDVSPHVVCLYG